MIELGPAAGRQELRGYSAGEQVQMTNGRKLEKKAWRKPVLKSIEAGSAEAGTGNKGDSGAGKRS